MVTVTELSNEFDVLYDNITSGQAPGLNVYEKSIFLTKAQDEIIKSYFNPKLNKPQDGFDDSEVRQIDFSSIINTEHYLESSFKSPNLDSHYNSVTIALTNPIMMIINEFVYVTRDNKENKSTRLNVIPLDYREYSRLISKPYKRPLKNQAWRLFSDSNTVELIVGPTDSINKYTIRYVRKPNPIILDSLGDYSIDGKSEPQELELNPILYPEILQRAVELAKAAYVAGDLQTQLVLGTSSQTNIGVIPQSK